MKRAIALGMTAAAMAVAGCTEARSQNGDPVVDRNYQVGEFDRIELAGPYDARVRTGSAISVHARGNEKAIDNLEVVVEDGALVIRSKKKMGFNWGKSGKVALDVTVPSLRGAEIAGSGDIRIDRVAGDSFDGGIAGSGNLTVSSVEVNRLKMSIGGGGESKTPPRGGGWGGE